MPDIVAEPGADLEDQGVILGLVFEAMALSVALLEPGGVARAQNLFPVISLQNNLPSRT
ncbi:MAG: hypothetical protein ACJAU6_004276 [Alphaproteobacteria bacterium]|jgi:hypothetical protein